MIKDSDVEKLQKMKDDMETYIPTQGNRFGDYAFGGFMDEEDQKQEKQHNENGLRYPSIDNLLEVVDSKYKLAYIAAKRAKVIKRTDHTSADHSICDKPVGKALEEILEGKVTAKFE